MRRLIRLRVSQQAGTARATVEIFRGARMANVLVPVAAVTEQNVMDDIARTTHILMLE